MAVLEETVDLKASTAEVRRVGAVLMIPDDRGGGEVPLSVFGWSQVKPFGNQKWSFKKLLPDLLEASDAAICVLCECWSTEWYRGRMDECL